MKLSQIELLHALVETPFNLSKAAEKLDLAQSAVSRQLQLFEAEIGAPLFARKGKKLVALTPLGQRIMDEVAAINQAKRNIHAIAADFLDHQESAIRIASTHTLAKYFLPEPIRRFREKHPDTRIYITQVRSEQLPGLLHKHAVDIAVGAEAPEDGADLIIQSCCEWRYAAVVPKNHPLSTGELTCERLASFRILTYAANHVDRVLIDKTLKDRRLTLNISLTADDADVIKTYVRLGLGVGIIADIAYDQQGNQDFVIRDLSTILPKSTINIAYLKQGYLSLTSRHFIDEVLS
jgi:DNA-binding transcriptional LysR family regulator